MKGFALLLLLAGLIAAPGYYFYCTLASGSEIDEITVFSQEVSSISAGGFTFRQSGNSKWNSPVPVELTPEMNPIAVNAKARYMKPTSGLNRRTRFVASILKDTDKIWEDGFSVSAQKPKKQKEGISIGEVGLPRTTIHLGSLTVADSGTYTLDVRQEGEKDVAVASLKLQLRRNVLIPNMKVVMGGGAAIVISIIGFVGFKKKSHS